MNKLLVPLFVALLLAGCGCGESEEAQPTTPNFEAVSEKLIADPIVEKEIRRQFAQEPGMTLIEAESAGRYEGTWQKVPVLHPQCHGGFVKWHYGLDDPSTVAVFEFEGTSVAVIFQFTCRSGLVDIFVDGVKYGVEGSSFQAFADSFTYSHAEFPEARVWSPLTSAIGVKHSLDTYDNDGWGVGQFIYRDLLISNTLKPGKHVLKLVAVNDSSYQGHDMKDGDGSFAQWNFRGAAIVSVDADLQQLKKSLLIY